MSDTIEAPDDQADTEAPAPVTVSSDQGPPTAAVDTTVAELPELAWCAAGIVGTAAVAAAVAAVTLCPDQVSRSVTPAPTHDRPGREAANGCAGHRSTGHGHCAAEASNGVHVHRRPGRDWWHRSAQRRRLTTSEPSVHR